MADTGSWHSLMSREKATKLKIPISHKSVCFSGVGKQLGIQSQPVELSVIIGLEALGKLNGTVICTQRSIAFVGLEEEQIRQNLLHKTPKTSSVEEEVETPEQRLKSICVPDSQQTWESPKPGQCRMPPVAWTVLGPPRKERVRPIAPSQEEELRKQVNAMLKSGVLRPSASPWASRPHFEKKKKTGDWRIVIDYRFLNKAMVKDSYRLPLLWEAVQEAAGHKIYHVLDLANGFFNIPLEESTNRSRLLTAY
eukprot:GHVP01063280.1.p1 GENE.GHVP01063280.1~~GHVP01063280.1.p1  ORF type:complete len:252 (+),score=24.49 GHVP01063280.1:214-969(+)